MNERAHPTRREQQRCETRAEILSAARILLRKRGYEAMSTRAVAEHAGVAVGTVFAHFHDKAALVEALLHDQVEAALEAAMATLPVADLTAQLVHVAGRLFDAYRTDAELSRVYLRESLFFAADREGILAPQLRRFERWAVARCAEAVERGEIGPLEPRLAFVAFFSFYIAMLIAGLRGELAPEEQLRTMTALVRRHFGQE